MSHNITIEGGTSVRLLTKGKYCDRDIVVTSEGGSEDLNEVLTEQETLITTLQETLRGKTGDSDSGEEVATSLENTMTNAERIQANNAELQECIEIAETLPDSGVSWDTLQRKGTRQRYQYAFMDWDCEYIRPKYKVAPTKDCRMSQVFYSNPSLKIIEKEYFDFSNIPEPTYASIGEYYTFEFCYALEVIEDIGLLGKYYNGTFHNCYKLHTIERLPFREDTAIAADPFLGCTSLANVTIDGVIATTVNFKDCPFTKASFMSIFEHLSDTVTGKTITFKKTAVNNAFGINIDDESTYTVEWNTLRNSKSNWTFNFV